MKLLIAAGVAVLSPWLEAAASDDEHESGCQEHLQAIATGLMRFVALNEGKLPDKMSRLHQEGYVVDLRQFTCPASSNRLASAEQIDAQTDYELMREISDTRPLLLVKEKAARHRNEALEYYSDRTFRKVRAPATNSTTVGSSVAVSTPVPITAVTNSDGNLSVTLKGPAQTSAFYDVLGREHYRNGRWSEAASAYREAARIEPTNVWHHLNLGMSLGQLVQWREAEPALHMAIRLKPDLALGHDQLGHAYFAQQKWLEAEAAYREAIQREPANASYHAHLAATFRLQARWSDAETFAREAARLEPNQAVYHLELGHTYAFQNKWNEAEAPYREALRLDPSRAGAHAGLGHVYATRNQLAEAEFSYRQAITLNPNFAQAYADRAGVLFRSGRREEARSSAQEAIRRGHQQHWVYRELGVAP